MTRIDINADLGEGYGRYRVADDAALMRLITSANIACGFHAGDPRIMDRTVRMAIEHGVRIGAHIGYPDREGFGRRAIAYEPDELAAMTAYQLGALQAVATRAGGRVTHANFHGALGNLTFVDEPAAHAVLQAVREVDRSIAFIALPHTVAHRVALELGMPVVTSFLSDRAYTPQGLLASRSQPGAVIHESAAIAARVHRMLTEGTIQAVDGTSLAMRAQSILVHSDTDGAVAIAHVIRDAVAAAGGEVAPFAVP